MSRLTRTAQVVFVPDPYIALMFKHCLTDEIDQLLVSINGDGCPGVQDFIADLFKDHTVKLHRHHSNQGQGFDELYPLAEGDILITLCSDNFIFKKGIIDEFSSKIESGQYDAVGSTGLHATPPRAADEIAAKIGTVRFNPFMGFFRKSIIDRIDELTFQSIEMKKGDKIGEIGYTYPEDGRLDVMAEMSIKFMALTNKNLIITPDRPPDYIHASGLSGGVVMHLSNGKNGALCSDSTHALKLGYKRPILSWLWFLHRTMSKDCPLKQFNMNYEKALEKKRQQSDVTMEEVEEDIARLKELL